MEYNFYLEQRYLESEGRVEARVLTAEQARAKGYEDGHKKSCSGYWLFVDGFDSREDIEHYVSDLVNCTIITEGGESPAHGPSPQKKSSKRDQGTER